MDPADIIASIELPSTNSPDWIHAFVEEVNRQLPAGANAHVLIDWRSNRRFLTVAKGKPRSAP